MGQTDCGHPRCQIGDLEGGGCPRCQIDGCAGIHDVEIWVSGWGGESGGKVTRSQPPPVGCLGWLKLGCLGWLKLGCLGWAKLGCLGWLKLGVSAVCSYSKTARNRGWGITRSQPPSIECLRWPLQPHAGIGIDRSEPMNPTPSCGFEQPNP